MLGRHLMEPWFSTQATVFLSSGQAEFRNTVACVFLSSGQAEFYGVVKVAGLGFGHGSLLSDVGSVHPLRVHS